MNAEEDIIVFDLETKALIPKLVSKKERVEAIRNLEISVVCVYSYTEDDYYFFTEDTIGKLFQIFNKAVKIVGFNIVEFDYKVLEKYGLVDNLVRKSFDLFDKIRKETGNWYSLDKLSRENLGKGKLYKGKELANMKGTDLYDGCKADVQNTKELYDLWLNGKLKYDKKGWQQNRILNDDEWGYSFETYETCPFCGKSTLEKFDELREGMGYDSMTDGQMAEYLAGSWGTYYCTSCGHSFDYEL